MDAGEQSAIDAIIVRHQLTNGTGSVILYQIENEYASNLTSQAIIGYMSRLYDKARADGIAVPIFHNDKGRNGDWVPGSFPEAPADGNYLYAPSTGPERRWPRPAESSLSRGRAYCCVR